MQSSKDISKLMLEALLNLDDEELCARVEAVLKDLQERDQRISEVLDDLLAEVDELILMADELEGEGLEEEDEGCQG